MELSDSSKKKVGTTASDMINLVNRAVEIVGDNSALAFEIVQGRRTQAQQNRLYAQGRTRPGKVVTWTRNSKHLGGTAVDFAAKKNGRISWDVKLYPPIAAVFRQASEELGIGIVWGGEWRKKDFGHIQLDAKRNGRSEAAVIAPDVKVPFYGVLKKGSKGALVSDVQKMLRDAGNSPGPIDADFGPRTDLAVRSYQRKKRGLAVDGKVGPLTFAKLSREKKKQGRNV